MFDKMELGTIPCISYCCFLRLASAFFIRSYFFTVEFLTELVKEAGFDVVTCHYVHRRTVNKKEGVDEPRVFVQGKFMKR